MSQTQFLLNAFLVGTNILTASQQGFLGSAFGSQPCCPTSCTLQAHPWIGAHHI